MLGFIVKSLRTYNAKKYYLSHVEFIHSFGFKSSPCSYYHSSDRTYYVVNKISHYNGYFTLSHPCDNYSQTPFSTSKCLPNSFVFYPNHSLVEHLNLKLQHLEDEEVHAEELMLERQHQLDEALHEH